MNRTFWLAPLGLAVLAAPVGAQEIPVPAATVVPSVRPDWMARKVTLSLKDAWIGGALKQVTEAVGLKRVVVLPLTVSQEEAVAVVFGATDPTGTKLELSPAEMEAALQRVATTPFGNPITTELKGVTAEAALARLSALAAVRITVRVEDGVTLFSLVKTPEAVRILTFNGSGILSSLPSQEANANAFADTLRIYDAQSARNSDAQSALDEAKRYAEALASAAKKDRIQADVLTDKRLADLTRSVSRRMALPARRVKLDVRNTEARDALKTILRLAGLDFALEGDIPSKKVSLTFENLPIDLALDVVCETIGVGWRSEERDGNPVVRVGTKYLGERVDGDATHRVRTLASPAESRSPREKLPEDKQPERP